MYGVLVRAWQEARQAPWRPADPTLLAVLGKAIAG
jgi:hypothetical protein